MYLLIISLFRLQRYALFATPAIPINDDFLFFYTFIFCHYDSFPYLCNVKIN